MKVRIQAETLRGFITRIYDCSMYESGLSKNSIIKMCLGDFYMHQKKYTRVVSLEVL